MGRRLGWRGGRGRGPEWIWAAENEELGVARGWLEHISVRRPWRRRGLGRAITAEALRRLAAAGMTDAMLGVDADNPTGALGLYEGLGFEVDQRSQVYRRPLVD
ncbi:MAG: GNAT family N-acetyltransferase [Chloroflexi bacterium]|nr:GNAT family N-acetyltransferase [Chloroflexota bacterium]